VFVDSSNSDSSAMDKLPDGCAVRERKERKGRGSHKLPMSDEALLSAMDLSKVDRRRLKRAMGRQRISFEMEKAV